MDVLRRFPVLVLALSSQIPGCGPIDISISGDDSPSDQPPPPLIINLGGSGPGEDPSGLGGEGAIEVLPVDSFDDGDTKGTDPAGWWYTVNDGTGIQERLVVPATEGPSGGDVGGYVLRVEAEGFSDWGSAFGVDMGAYDLGDGAVELEFRIAADKAVDVVFHAIDGSGAHFTKNLSVTPSWTLVNIRLDQMFIVDADGVRRFDVTTPDELQWFRFDGDSNTIWLDDVVLRTNSSRNLTP